MGKKPTKINVFFRSNHYKSHTDIETLTILQHNNCIKSPLQKETTFQKKIKLNRFGIETEAIQKCNILKEYKTVTELG